MAIGIDDIKIHYVPIREARQMSGLRIVLGAFAVPGPWHEACKGIFHVKGLDYTPVRSADEGASDALIGMGGSQSELVAWTAQSSASVATPKPASHGGVKSGQWRVRNRVCLLRIA